MVVSNNELAMSLLYANMVKYHRQCSYLPSIHNYNQTGLLIKNNQFIFASSQERNAGVR
jgi:hypothetical protein